MEEYVSHIQGSKENYNPSTMQGGIFFSKDTKEILLNGDSYGGHPADEEDITEESGKLKFKDRVYDEANFSGKGYVILRKNIVDGKNILTLEMINQSNTVYEIRYDFDLNEDTITIPEGCTLKFEGGSLSNGIISGNSTEITNANSAFNGISFSGTFSELCNVNWFKDNLKDIFSIANLFSGIILNGNEYDLNAECLINADTFTIIGNGSKINFKVSGNSDIILFHILDTCKKFVMKDISIVSEVAVGTAENRWGVALQNEAQLSLILDLVNIHGFNKSLNLLILIHSTINNCRISNGNYGVIVRTSTDVATSTRFTNCYISANKYNVTLEQGSIIDISFIGCIFEAACYYNIKNYGANEIVTIDNCYFEDNSRGYDYNGGIVLDLDNVKYNIYDWEVDSSILYEHTRTLVITNSNITGSNVLSNLGDAIKFSAGRLYCANNRFSRFNNLIDISNVYSNESLSRARYNIYFHSGYFYSTTANLFNDESILTHNDMLDVCYITNGDSKIIKTPDDLKFDYYSYNRIKNGLFPSFGYRGVLNNSIIINSNGVTVLEINEGMAMFGKHTLGKNPLTVNGIGITDNLENIQNIINLLNLTENNYKLYLYLIPINGVLYVALSDGTTYKYSQIGIINVGTSKLIPLISSKGDLFFDTELKTLSIYDGEMWIDSSKNMWATIE